MFKRALQLSIRQLLQQKSYSLVHIIGIAVGFASCYQIALYVHGEYHYDRFFHQSEDIYKMVESNRTSGDEIIKATVPYSYAGIVREQYPEVSEATSISGPYNNQNVSISLPNAKRRNFLEKAVFLADSNYFKVFSWKLLAGDRETALLAPNSVVLTAQTAKRYFGDTNPVGQTIQLGHRSSTVTAVCETPPKNSHFAFNYLVSASTVSWFSQEEFNLRTAHCYIKLKPDTPPNSVVAKFPALVDQYFWPALQKLQETNRAPNSDPITSPEYLLKPLHSLHLDPNQLGSMKPAGNRQLLRILILVAVFILCMAVINYVNLSTVQSTKRDKVIAVNKIIGASKGQIIGQFLLRSTLLAAVGIGLGLLMVQLALPLFNSFMDVGLSIDWGLQRIAIYGLLVIVVGLMAGIYPAIKLSAISPINLYNPRVKRKLAQVNTRDALMVFQFTVAIILLVATSIIHGQRNLLVEKDLGFTQEQVLVLEGTFERDPMKGQGFLQALQAVPEIKGSAGSLWVQSFNSFISGDEYQNYQQQETVKLHRISVGDGYTELLNIPVLTGEGFSVEDQDSNTVLLNQAAVQVLGLAEAVGKDLVRITEDGPESFRIKGIVQDFHFEALDNEIKPLVIQSNEYYSGRMSYFLLKLAPTSNRKTLAQIEEYWEKFMPNKPFIYRFLDENLQAQYEQEERLGQVFGLYTMLSLFICFMGLFSLAAYHVQIRQKEVGIRKIVGASVNALLQLLSKDYMRLVMLSFLLAVPISAWMAQHWLANFATRIDLDWKFFLLPGLAVLILSFSCIAYQIIHLAKKSPVEALSVND
ncbi:MAG: FtsX-like permease family protein [Cyanothece sp. SIO1E1]|nr:FtsX-like permease family protein [Cyanothece sp. SIO1E1]